MPPTRSQPKRSAGPPHHGVAPPLANPSTSKPNTKSTSITRHSSRAPKLNASRILTSSSPLSSSTYNILTLLSHLPQLWPTYTLNEQHALLATLPPAYRTPQYEPDGNLACPLSQQFLETDEFLRNGVAKFKRDVKEGYYEKTWQDEARKAMRERRDGKFDDWLREKVERDFGEVEDAEDDSGHDGENGGG